MGVGEDFAKGGGCVGCGDAAGQAAFDLHKRLAFPDSRIRKQIEPPKPIDEDTYDLPSDKLDQIPSMPPSLDAALQALEEDRDFLLEGGVFSENLIDAWIGYKREHEIDPVRTRPHPWEFYLYYDI